MNIYDSELLTKKQEKLVTDGLLFWLDGRDALYGIDEGSTPGAYRNAYMYDRVGSKTVSLSNSYDPSANLITSVPPFIKYIADAGQYWGTTSFSPVSGVLAIEVVCDRINKANWCMVDANKSSGRIVFSSISSPRVYIEGWRVITGTPTHFVFTADPITNTPKIYQNGIDKTEGTGGQCSALTVNDMIRPFIPISESGINVGCFRLYNRGLTADEVLQNMNYEISIGRLAV